MLTFPKVLREALGEKLPFCLPSMGQSLSVHVSLVLLLFRAKIVIGDLNTTGGQNVVDEITNAGGYVNLLWIVVRS